MRGHWSAGQGLGRVGPYSFRRGSALADRHLFELAQRQRPDGSIPILFLDGPEGHVHFLGTKLLRTLATGRVSFMLRRYLTGNLGRLTPGTRDSELHFVRAALAQGAPGMTAHIERAVRYIQRNLLNPQGLLKGADWRDTMDEELCSQPLLTNNAIWYGVLRKLGQDREAAIVREALAHRRCGLYGDYPGAERPDPLGLALGLENGLFGEGDLPEILRLLREVQTPYGVTIQCKHNAYSGPERDVIARTRGIVVWPFVVGYVVLALRRARYNLDTRSEIFSDLREVLNLNTAAMAKLGTYEWYDPATGIGWGSPEQGWSAALRVNALL